MCILENESAEARIERNRHPKKMSDRTNYVLRGGQRECQTAI